MLKKILFFVTLLFGINQTSNAQADWSGFDLLGHYPLNTDAKEIDSKTEDLTLLNIPFDDKGAYSNGIYLGSFEDGCKIQTPVMSKMDIYGFGISLDILYDTTYNASIPIFVVGEVNRYASLYLDMWQGDVKLKMVKNYGEITVISEIIMSENTWYHLDLQHKNDITSFYLDGNKVGEDVGPFEYYDGEDDDRTRTISNRHSGEGQTYRGYWKDLKIYSLPITAASFELEISKVLLYPNPVSDELTISLEEACQTEVLISDLQGQILDKFIFENGGIVSIDVRDFAKGIYSIQLKSYGNSSSFRRFIKQ